MGRKPKVEEEPKSEQEPEPEEQDEIRAKHRELINKCKGLEERIAFFEEGVGQEVKEEIIKVCEERIASAMQENVDPGTKSDQVRLNAGRVEAWREIRSIITGLKYSDELEAAKTELKVFEEQNALLIG